MGIRTGVIGLTMTGVALSTLPGHGSMEAPRPAIVAEDVPEPEGLAPLIPEVEGDESSVHSLAHYDTTTGLAVVEDWVPEEYREEIEATVLNPLLRYAVEKGYITAVEFYSGEKDNAGFIYPLTPGETAGRLQFTVGSSFEDRLFAYPGAMERFGVHEVAHAVASSWYAPLYNGNGIEAVNPEIREPLERMQELCRNIRTDLINDYINGNRETLTEIYRQASVDFTALGGELLHDDDPGNDDRKERMDTLAGVVARTATRIESGGGYTRSTPDDERICPSLGPIEFPLLEAQMTGGTEHMGEYHLEDPADPIIEVERDYRDRIARGYECIQDSAALSDLLGVEIERGGHAYENLTELFASTMATLESNPQYLQDCIESLPTDVAEQFTELVQLGVRIAEITDPEFIQLIRLSGPDQRNVLVWLEAA